MFRFLRTQRAFEPASCDDVMALITRTFSGPVLNRAGYLISRGYLVIVDSADELGDDFTPDGASFRSDERTAVVACMVNKNELRRDLRREVDRHLSRHAHHIPQYAAPRTGG